MKKTLAMLITIMLTVAALAGCAAAEQSEGTGENEAQGVSAAENEYIILVQDANDAAPLSGAMVQFCSDTLCTVGLTDTTGTASFEAAPGSYTAHVLKAPEGYEGTEEEIALTAEGRVAVFALRKTDEAQKDTESEETADKTDKYADTWDFRLFGFSIRLPAVFKDLMGQFCAIDRAAPPAMPEAAENGQ